MKFDEKGKPTFFDEKDRASYRALLSSIRKSNTVFDMTISLHADKSVSENQKRLYNLLVDMIATESGNDVNTIEETLLGWKKEKVLVQDMDNKMFNEFLEHIITFSNEFFNLNVSVNENGLFQINKIR